MKEIFSEVFLHMAMFITFLMVFFFFFVVWIQKKAMIRDFADMVKSVDPSINLSGVSVSNLPFTVPQNVQDSITLNNQNVLFTVATVIPTLVISLIAGAYVIAPHCFWHNALNTLGALPFIAFAEFLIMGTFFYNYIVIDAKTVTQIVSNFTGQNPSGDCGYMYNTLSKVIPTWLLGIAGITPTTGVFS